MRLGKKQLWELDGGFCDQHRVMLDENGELWGWENVKPRDPMALQYALLNNVSQYHHYAVSEVTV